MSKKIIKFFATALGVLLASVVIGYAIESFSTYGELIFDLTMVFNGYVGISALILCGVWFFIWFSKLDVKGSGSSGASSSDKKNAKDKKQDESQYYNGDWLSVKDMHKRFIYSRYKDLRKISMKNKQGYYGAGVVVEAQLIGKENKGDDMHITIVPPVNTLVVGNTRSGKGESFIRPNLQILSELDTKPSFIISDPKGELYELHAAKFRKRGYDVKVFDLRHPFKSEKWNPLKVVYDSYQEAINIKKEVYLHRNESPAQCGIKYMKDVDYGDAWFEFRGEAYATELEMETAVEGTKQVILGEISATVKDIVNILIPLDDPKQASWVNGARGFACAVLFAMLEDSADPSLGMTRDKYNFYNFYRIINIKSDDEEDRFSILRDYFENRSPIFGIKELANAVTTSGPTTASSFLSVLTPAIDLFADPAICFVTSDTEIDFSTISTKPTAFFIKVPDEIPVYHKIAGIMIEQLYKDLVKTANEQGGSLKRSVIYMLDEFANIPKIEKMNSYISVGAGRHIFFFIIVQDYSQLSAKYGESDARTVKNNCNLKVFVGSNEMSTLKEFNELLGRKTVSVTDETKTTPSGKSGDKSKSESTREHQRDLMFVEELQVLPEDNLIFVLTKCPPMRTICTRAYKCSGVYDMEKTKDDFKQIRFLNIEKISYDINGYLNKQEKKPSSRKFNW